jgi:hypothetical protein
MWNPKIPISSVTVRYIQLVSTRSISQISYFIISFKHRLPSCYLQKVCIIGNESLQMEIPCSVRLPFQCFPPAVVYTVKEKDTGIL